MPYYDDNGKITIDEAAANAAKELIMKNGAVASKIYWMKCGQRWPTAIKKLPC